uniref:Uncharacterized protein n=1 Tax=Arundo donax TaxID=35708 RepID=A0A0A8ZYC1_ARUDO
MNKICSWHNGPSTYPQEPSFKTCDIETQLIPRKISVILLQVVHSPARLATASTNLLGICNIP